MDMRRMLGLKNPLSISRVVLLLSIFATVLAVSIIVLVSAFIRDRAIHDLARDEARQTSVLVFESLYSAMRKGWTKAEIGEVITRLQVSRPDLAIHVIRGAPVVRQFGEYADDKQRAESDPLIRAALATGEEQLSANESSIRYLYPVKVRPECRQCHTMAAEGDVNGVIDIVYPVRNLKVSLSFVVNTVITYFLVIILILCSAIYIKLKLLVARPITELVRVMREIMQYSDLSKRINADGHWISEVSALTSCFNRLLSTIQDYQSRVEELSIKDPLTGLYNRRKFEDFLAYEVDRSQRHDHSFSLIMLDIDNFKHINDTYGHPIGDLALKQLAGLMMEGVRRSDVLARLGGDEFALLLPETGPEGALAVAEALRQKIAATALPLPVGNIRLSASLGHASFPDNGAELQKLIIAMDVAMYKAKRSGKNRVATVNSDEEAAFTEVFDRGDFVRRALDEGRLVPYAQPIIHTGTGAPMAYELLARIIDGNDIILAGQFIEVADELGLSRQIDERIIELGLAFLRRQPRTVPRLFINLSPRTLSDATFMRSIPARLDAAGIDPSRLVFELTEREALPHLKEVIDLVKELRALGIGFALDDFGSGFSSFTYLKYLPVDYVKIEGSFVRHMALDGRDRIMVDHIATIARQFGVTAIAEFVEDEETLQLLRGLSIDGAQGYHCGRPADLNSLAAAPEAVT